MAGSTVVYIGLGSNVGDREAHLRQAVRRLALLPRTDVRRVSPVYESEPHTLEPDDVQAPYLNAVVEVMTDLAPEALLEKCLGIEREEGRDRDGERRWAPRTLDLDLLVYDDHTLSTEALTIPHPRLGERRFVLRPLADLAPGLWVPAPYQRTVDEMLAACPDTDEPRRIDGSLDPAIAGASRGEV